MTESSQDDCGCCEGRSARTPILVYNPPGLSSIKYRTGTHSRFKQSMLSGLSDPSRPELRGLKTREDGDLSIALLDAWAMVADVLTFYQERIANESYIRTASEMQSVYQLAGLIGYRPRPGLASSTNLAFFLESAEGAPDKVIIKEGTKVQSIPGPGQLPRIFETVQEIEAFPGHNELRPRLTQTQKITSESDEVVLEGISLGLRPGDGLLFNIENQRFFCRVESVKLIAEKNQTTIGFSKQFAVKGLSESARNRGYGVPDNASVDFDRTEDVLDYGKKSKTPGKKMPRRQSITGKGAKASNNGYAVQQKPSSFSYTTTGSVTKAQLDQYGAAIDAQLAELLLALFDPYESCNEKNELKPVSKPSTERVDLPSGVTVFRARAQIFGHNAPKFDSLPNSLRNGDYVIAPDPTDSKKPLYKKIPGPYNCRDCSWVDTTLNCFPSQGTNLEGINLFLDSIYPIAIDSLIILFDGHDCEPYMVEDSIETSLSDFTLTAKVSALKLKGNPAAFDKFEIRQTIVFGQGEELTLAKVDHQDKNVSSDTIEVDGYQKLLKSGPIIVCGNLNKDDDGDPKTCELVNISDVIPLMDGEDRFSVIKLQKGLNEVYKKETVIIYANLAPATEGESKEEIIGSGNASEPFQSFSLFQAPLTFVPDVSTEGFSSTLKVYVNDVKWHEVRSLHMSGPKDRVYTVLLNNDGKATIKFGDGVNGARLPTGRENVRAVYRTGLGREGDVDAGKLSLLMTMPLGVKGVKNPMATSGGTDAEELESARINASLDLFTLGRLVSLQDYSDYARAYPGIGKALAAWTWSNQVRGILVTVCGQEGQDLDENSLQCIALLGAMHKFGDPSIPILIKKHSKAFFRVSASVKISSDYISDQVLSAVRSTVMERFSGKARNLGQSVGVGEVMAAIQSVPGVEAAMVSRLYRIPPVPPIVEEFSTIIYASAPKGGENTDSVQAAELLTIDPNLPSGSLGLMT